MGGAFSNHSEETLVLVEHKGFVFGNAHCLYLLSNYGIGTNITENDIGLQANSE